MERNSKKTITIRHTYTAEEVNELRRIQRERAKLDNDEHKLRRSVLKDEKAKLAAKLAGYGMPPEVDLGYNEAVLKFSISERIVEDEKPQPPAPKRPTPVAQVYVEPKLLNALLHGKLLTDAEKRKLVARVIPDDVLDEGEQS